MLLAWQHVIIQYKHIVGVIYSIRKRDVMKVYTPLQSLSLSFKSDDIQQVKMHGHFP